MMTTGATSDNCFGQFGLFPQVYVEIEPPFPSPSSGLTAPYLQRPPVGVLCAKMELGSFFILFPLRSLN